MEMPVFLITSALGGIVVFRVCCAGTPDLVRVTAIVVQCLGPILGSVGLARIAVRLILPDQQALIDLFDRLTALVPAYVGGTCGFALACQVRPIHTHHAGQIAKGLAWHIALAFIGFDLGKLIHDAAMREFFHASGLSTSLMYTVLLTEAWMATSLLFYKNVKVSASVLAFIMVCAISTHLRNHDPLADSADAVRMLVLCLALLSAASGTPGNPDDRRADGHGRNRHARREPGPRD